MNDPEFVATDLMMREIIRNRNSIKYEGFVFVEETIGGFPYHEEVVTRKCHKLATPFRLKWCGWSVTVVGLWYYLPATNNDWRWLGSIYLAYRINREKRLRISAWGCFPFSELTRFYEFLMSNLERRIK